MKSVVQQLVIVVLALILAGCAGVPRRADLPAGPTPHTIYLVQYGWHTALLLDGASALAHSKKLAADFHDTRYLLVGWGDGEYFVSEHAPWSKAVKALVASDYPALQVGERSTNPPLGAQARDIVALAITEHGYQQLVEYIDRSIAADAGGKPIYLGTPGEHPDRFYRATGNYSVFNNCNSWMSDALRTAGLPVSSFNLTARGVFEQAERISALQQQAGAN
ncbi:MULTISPECIES: DUF2459 domain-containing protein [unclassified Duganella]|uniref:DUF2459 domain-containing protein n=1 Tax=unclassified Duganella TaxID=2636909 RepID=UPI00088E1A23|nr:MULTISPECIES: DUF2459 domain-containing protein [unclassified Duganella]SDG77634.1 conserved hypothetical protein [Duganella sp. OV458]SDK04635.1 conserved hypothetical protein [Duganella sp. OV510]